MQSLVSEHVNNILLLLLLSSSSWCLQFTKTCKSSKTVVKHDKILFNSNIANAPMICKSLLQAYTTMPDFPPVGTLFLSAKANFAQSTKLSSIAVAI